MMPESLHQIRSITVSSVRSCPRISGELTIAHAPKVLLSCAKLGRLPTSRPSGKAKQPGPVRTSPAAPHQGWCGTTDCRLSKTEPHVAWMSFDDRKKLNGHHFSAGTLKVQRWGETAART